MWLLFISSPFHLSIMLLYGWLGGGDMHACGLGKRWTLRGGFCTLPFHTNAKKPQRFIPARYHLAC